MSEVKLAATVRTEFGKGAARRIRRAHQIPAVLYGHGVQPIHVTLPGHETFLALKHQATLFAIDLDGDSKLAIVKDVQRDRVRQIIEHLDLLIVEKGEKVAVDVPVHVIGEAAPGTIHLLDVQSVSVEAEATHLPVAVEVSIEGLEAGSQRHASDIVLPAGVTLLSDPETVVATVSEPQIAAEVEAAEESAETASGDEAQDEAAEA